MTTPITATVPNKLVGDHRSDLLLVGLLKAAGIPAVSVNPGWKFGITTSVPGTVTSVQGKETTVFTWVPTPVPPTAQETQLAALQAGAESSASLIRALHTHGIAFQAENDSLTAQLATANAKVASMTTELATANEQIAAFTKQITAAESNLKPTSVTTGSTGPAAA
jgi:hypothetical protein